MRFDLSVVILGSPKQSNAREKHGSYTLLFLLRSYLYIMSWTHGAQEAYSANKRGIYSHRSLLEQINSHVHQLVAWGLFDDEGNYHGMPKLPGDAIRDVFRDLVFKMMLKEDLISEDIVENMKFWPHSGFDVWVGPLISGLDAKGIENLGQY